MAEKSDISNGLDISDAIRANASAAGVPAWIAEDHTNISPVLRPAQKFLQLQCDHWSGLTPGLSAFAGQFMNDMCGPYLGPTGTPAYRPPGAPPFQGGQCPGEFYSINYTTVTDTFGSRTRTTTAVGPISIDQFSDGSSNTVRILDGNGDQVSGTGTTVIDPDVPTLTINSTTRLDGEPDDCGDPEGTPEGFDPPSSPRPTPAPTTPYTPPGGGPTIPISLTGPQLDVNGGLSFSGSIGPIEIDLGGLAGTGPPAGGDGPAAPDFGSPSPPESPNPGGGPGEPGNPPDGIDFDGSVAAVRVTIAEESSAAGREVGGPEDIFIPEVVYDAGWFRWKVGGGFSPEIRITSRQEIFVYSVGECQEADGYQVKFTDGFSGSAVSYICQE